MAPWPSLTGAVKRAVTKWCGVEKPTE